VAAKEANPIPSRRFLAVFVALVLIVSSSVGYFLLENSPSDCSVLGGKSILRSKLTPLNTGGAVTTYSLPPPDRYPNGVAVSADGSVWFGEQGVPGLGHLYSNGTLVEYAWPFSYPGRSSPSQTCAQKTAIWTVVIWNGRVWAGDVTGNQLVGLDPATGSVKTIKLNSTGAFPYGLTAGPDGALWFTELFAPKIGRVDTAGNLEEYSLNGNRSAPAEISFANSTRGYYVDVGAGLYQFNPQKFAPVQVGGGMNLFAPSSISLGTGGIWVTQHEAASLAFYDLATKGWTIYPTSTVSYVDTTLPYFVRVNGSKVWFNEHYADRIAVIDITAQTLTEYSIQGRRPASVDQITNSLTFAFGSDRVWFAESTENTIGFVDATFKPALGLSLAGSNNLRLAAGGKTNVNLSLSDAIGTRLTLQAADSENFTSIPRLLRVTPTPANLTLSESPQLLPLTIQVDSNTRSGEYTLLVTVSDGQVYRSVYVKVQVVP
jgi:virginiamycin B lyase